MNGTLKMPPSPDSLGSQPLPGPDPSCVRGGSAMLGAVEAQVLPSREPMPALMTPACNSPALPNWQPSGSGPVNASP